MNKNLTVFLVLIFIILIISGGVYFSIKNLKSNKVIDLGKSEVIINSDNDLTVVAAYAVNTVTFDEFDRFNISSGEYIRRNFEKNRSIVLFSYSDECYLIKNINLGVSMLDKYEVYVSCAKIGEVSLKNLNNLEVGNNNLLLNLSVFHGSLTRPTLCIESSINILEFNVTLYKDELLKENFPIDSDKCYRFEDFCIDDNNYCADEENSVIINISYRTTSIIRDYDYLKITLSDAWKDPNKINNEAFFNVYRDDNNNDLYLKDLKLKVTK